VSRKTERRTGCEKFANGFHGLGGKISLSLSRKERKGIEPRPISQRGEASGDIHSPHGKKGKKKHDVTFVRRRERQKSRADSNYGKDVLLYRSEGRTTDHHLEKKEKRSPLRPIEGWQNKLKRVPSVGNHRPPCEGGGKRLSPKRKFFLFGGEFKVGPKDFIPTQGKEGKRQRLCHWGWRRARIAYFCREKKSRRPRERRS